jgi:hypothetical protein
MAGNLTEIERLAQKEEYEKEHGIRLQDPKAPSILGLFKKKKKKKKDTRLDDTAEILALNKEARKRQQAERKQDRTGTANDIIDKWNKCLDETSVVGLPHLATEMNYLEKRLLRMKRTKGMLLSDQELRVLQVQMDEYVALRYQQHACAVSSQALVKRWNGFAARMYEISEGNMGQECASQIESCEKIIDTLTLAFNNKTEHQGKKKKTPPPLSSDEVNGMIQGVDSRLNQSLYPQLQIMEQCKATMNHTVRRWNEYATRMYKIGEQNLKHCSADIKACEETIDSMTSAWKKEESSAQQIESASQEIDTRLQYLYPQLRMMEIWFEINAIKTKIYDIIEGVHGNRIGQTLKDEYSGIRDRNLKLMEAVVVHNEHVEESEVSKVLSDFKTLEQKIVRFT